MKRFASSLLIVGLALSLGMACGARDSVDPFGLDDEGDGGVHAEAGGDARLDGSTDGDARDAHDGNVLDASDASETNVDAGTPVTIPYTRGGFDGVVTAVAHAGSSWYVGGGFTRVNSYHSYALMALDQQGNPAATCLVASDFDAPPEILLRSGNFIYAGGQFTTYKNEFRGNLIKINANDCTADVAFIPVGSFGSVGDGGFGNSGPFYGDVWALAVSGNSIYVGGQFANYGTSPANNIAKLDLTTGAFDTTFSPANANGFTGTFSYVFSLVAFGNSLYVGGSFSDYRGVSNAANSIAKLDLVTGDIDTNFSQQGATANGFDSSVSTLAVGAGWLYVGGNFTSYRGVSNSANHLAKLNLTNGSIDTNFAPPGAGNNGFNAAVTSLAVSSTALYVGGAFDAYRGVANSAEFVAKLDLTSGALDTTFSPPGANANGFDDSVFSVVVVGSSLYVGGDFTKYRGIAGESNYIAKLDLVSGAIDGSFIAPNSTLNGFDQPVSGLTVSGSSLLVLGNFSFYGGSAANSIAKLDDQTLEIDTTFNPQGGAPNGFDDQVTALAISGSSVYVGGAFSKYRNASQSASRLAKLSLTTGALDTTFSPSGAGNGFDGDVLAVAASDTSLYVGGVFDAYKHVLNSSHHLAKLDLTTGTIDSTFSPPGATSNGFDGQVEALVVSGGSVFAGGLFNSYRGVANSAHAIAKLNATTGVIDTTFSPPGLTSNGFTSGAAVQALATDGTSIFVGGLFSDYRGVAKSANFLAKLNPTTGSIDTTFSPAGLTANGFENQVQGLIASGGSLYVGGYFTNYRGVPNSSVYIAKLDSTSGALDTSFSPPNANGFDGPPNAFAFGNSQLAVVGSFENYRGAPVSPNFALLNPTTGAAQ